MVLDGAHGLFIDKSGLSSLRASRCRMCCHSLTGVSTAKRTTHEIPLPLSELTANTFQTLKYALVLQTGSEILRTPVTGFLGEVVNPLVDIRGSIAIVYAPLDFIGSQDDDQHGF